MITTAEPHRVDVASTSADEARRIRNAIVLSVVAANFVAAFLLFLLLNVLLPNPGDDFTTSLVNFVLVSVAAFPGAAIVGLWVFRPIEHWLVAGRPPTPTEERIVMDGPRIAAGLTFGFWVLTAAIIGGIEAADGGPFIEAVRDGAALFAAGLTSAALTYLLVERRARPLVAAALAGRPSGRSTSLGLRPRLLLSWALGSGVPFVAIAVGELSTGPNDPRISAEGAIFLVGVGLLVGLLMTTIAVKSVAEPVDAVRGALASVERGDLAVHVTVDDGGEIGRLQAGVNQMVDGLRERQHLADLFGRHVGSEVAQRAVEEGVGLGGERREASALFVDLRDSTGLAATTPPEDVVAVLNRFFGDVVEVVTEEGGWVNKFEGDGAMCIFGVPAAQPDHAGRALRAARRLQGRLEASGLRAVIGVSSGDVVAGNVGAEERYEYTVIGDPVNEAARLTDAAKDVPAGVLVSGAAVERAGDEARHWQPAGELVLRGRGSPTTLYTPVL